MHRRSFGRLDVRDEKLGPPAENDERKHGVFWCWRKAGKLAGVTESKSLLARFWNECHAHWLAGPQHALCAGETSCVAVNPEKRDGV